MNIGFDAKRAFHNRSGLGNYSRSTIRLLSRFYPENTYFLFSENENKNLVQLSVNQVIVKPKTVVSTLLPYFWRSWGINKQIRQHKLDIFHGLSNELPLNIKSSGVKSVVTIHDLIFLRYPEYYTATDRRIYSLKFRNTCKVADKIIAISESTKNDIVSFFGTDPGKIEVVYQTCDPVFSIPVDEIKRKEIRRKYKLSDQFILFLGTIEKRKNVLNLIKAYLNEKIEIPLVIAGKPTIYQEEINKFLLSYATKKQIIFRHNIESDDLPALYQSALIFVYPSVFEGFGIPILEAFYSGVPVITSTGSCFTETGGNAAIYCDPFNYEQMGATLSNVLNDSSLRQTMIKSGYEQAWKFNEHDVAMNLMKVYSDLL